MTDQSYPYISQGLPSSLFLSVSIDRSIESVRHRSSQLSFVSTIQFQFDPFESSNSPLFTAQTNKQTNNTDTNQHCVADMN